MLHSHLLEIIKNGENSGVEFKRDDIRPEELAKEIVALANLQGGMVLLGVEDNGTISGISRDKHEEWVMNIFRDKIHPFINPYYEEVTIAEKRIAIITIERGLAKPYVLRHNGQERIYIRIGSTSRDATREQQSSLYSSGGLLHAETLPVSGTSIDSLDMNRIRNYLQDIIEDPEIPQNEQQWLERLIGLGLLTERKNVEAPCATIAGIICFGINPRRYLPQSGIRVMAFSGEDKTYKALIDEVVNGPLLKTVKKDKVGNIETIDAGLIEKLTTLLRAFISEESNEIDAGMQRLRKWLYPWDAIRETIINAIIHRDWTRPVDIEIAIYSNRIEIISPGAMQNSMTIEKMKAGQRSPRNPILVGIMRDYGYVDARGMGVRVKIIPLMRTQNNSEPEFVANEDFLKVVLKRKQ